MKNTLKELLENDIEKYQKDVKNAEKMRNGFILAIFVLVVTVIYLSVSYVKQEKTIKLMKGKHYSDSLAIKSIEDNQRMGVEIRKFNELNK